MGRGQGNPYSNTYNQGWKNHPNFAWSNQGQQRAAAPPGFQPPPSIPERVSELEKVLSKFIQSTDARFQGIEATLRNHTASLHNLENQVGQIAKSLADRPQGSLPSNTEINPREHLKAITLRSGRQLEEKLNAEKNSEICQEQSPPEKAAENPQKNTTNKEKEVAVAPPSYAPRIPYPTRLKKDQMDEQNRKFLDLFKQLHINIPFVEALSQMPRYAKFLKDLLTNKRKMEESVAVVLEGECAAMLQKNLPNKMRDPGSFIIPCIIGGLGEEKALADSGASINVMPYTLFQKLGLGEPRPTRMTLQLADRSIRHPRGIIEDILVKVDRYIFPADFVVLDVEEDVEIPLILGRPFLRTSKALIDMDEGEMTLRVGDEKVTYRLADAMKHPIEFDDICYSLDVHDEIANDYLQEFFHSDPCEELLNVEGEKADFSLEDALGEQQQKGFLKQMLRRMKKTRQRQRKHSKALENKSPQGKGTTSPVGNILNKFSVSLQKFCPTCVHIAEDMVSVHEPS